MICAQKRKDGGLQMKTVEELKQIANDVRIDIIRQVSRAQSGHPGGSLGCTDILTVLYFNVMDITPENAVSISYFQKDMHHLLYMPSWQPKESFPTRN